VSLRTGTLSEQIARNLSDKQLTGTSLDPLRAEGNYSVTNAGSILAFEKCAYLFAYTR
jgi:hypothetical protein